MKDLNDKINDSLDDWMKGAFIFFVILIIALIIIIIAI